MAISIKKKDEFAAHLGSPLKMEAKPVVGTVSAQHKNGKMLLGLQPLNPLCKQSIHICCISRKQE